jgi:hypothetical protein
VIDLLFEIASMIGKTNFCFLVDRTHKDRTHKFIRKIKQGVVFYEPPKRRQWIPEPIMYHRQICSLRIEEGCLR